MSRPPPSAAAGSSAETQAAVFAEDPRCVLSCVTLYKQPAHIAPVQNLLLQNRKYMEARE